VRYMLRRLLESWRVTLVLLLVIGGFVAVVVVLDKDEAEAEHATEAEQYINDEFTLGEFDLHDAECPTFASLKDGETVSCTATATDRAGASHSARVEVELMNCRSIGNDKSTTKSCGFNFHGVVD
jgi:hypothetical protein